MTIEARTPEPLAVELSGVSVVFGRRGRRRTVLEDVGLRVAAGEVVGLMGPNGAGKTTLLRVLMGLVAPSAGSGRVCGHELGGGTYPRCGYLMENPPFVGSHDGRTNLRMLARIGRADVREADERMREVGLDPKDRTTVARYSQGMRKRLGLAQALMGSPDLLVLDEPMNGLDLRGRILFERLIGGAAGGGATVFVSSHDLAGLSRICSSAYVVCDARVVRVGERHPSEGELERAYLLATESGHHVAG